MKKILLTLTILSSLFSFSQSKGIAYYGYIEALDMGSSKGLDYNAFILFTKEQSYYVTAKDSLESPDKINEKKSFISEDGSQTSSYGGMKVSNQGDQVVYNIKKNTMWSNILHGKQLYVKEITPKINWKITNESKKIGNLVCKKATTNFRGRDYIAWFTPQITVPFGPWKLNGLPGLIVEAYDNDKFVYWYFKSLEYPTKRKESIKYINRPKDTPLMSYEEFKLYQKKDLVKLEDKAKIVQKQNPNVVFGEFKTSNMFIEFE